MPGTFALMSSDNYRIRSWLLNISHFGHAAGSPRHMIGEKTPPSIFTEFEAGATGLFPGCRFEQSVFWGGGKVGMCLRREGPKIV